MDVVLFLPERVLSLRKQYPRWGKDKLVVLLQREKRSVSTSMVGRILVHLKRRGALHEPPKPALLRQARRKLRKRPWATGSGRAASFNASTPNPSRISNTFMGIA